MAGFRNVYDRVAADILQVGWVFHPTMRGKFPLSEVATLPFVTRRQLTGSEALWRLYKTGILDSEYKDIVPLHMALTGFTGIHFAKEPRSIDDLSGVKVRVQSSSAAIMARALGMNPQSIPAGEMYVSLQRGTIDAALTSFAAFVPYKLAEVTSFTIEAPLGTSSNSFFMSRKKLQTLPAAARHAIEVNSGDENNRIFAKHFADQADEGKKMALAGGKHKAVEPSAEKPAAWEKTVGKPIIDDFLKSGPKAAEVLAAYRRIYAQVEAENKAKMK